MLSCEYVLVICFKKSGSFYLLILKMRVNTNINAKMNFARSYYKNSYVSKHLVFIFIQYFRSGYFDQVGSRSRLREIIVTNAIIFKIQPTFPNFNAAQTKL